MKFLRARRFVAHRAPESRYLVIGKIIIQINFYVYYKYTNMNATPPLELLELLVAVAESRNLVEAAARVGLSQPAVSMKLKTLETQLPLPAFARHGKRKVLTHYGSELYLAARTQLVLGVLCQPGGAHDVWDASGGAERAPDERCRRS